MVREAIGFIEGHRAQPFFLYFASNLPHYPYQPDAKWRARLKDLPYPRNLYAAFLAMMDERIGTLLRRVDQLGLRQRTIIVFQSDNGHSTEDRAHSGGGSAGPYRGAKFSLFEGGIRLPALISWPGKIPENAVRSQLAHGCDWFPTLAELCDVKPPNSDLDGKSLVAVLKSSDAPSPHHTLHWQVDNGTNKQWAVRQGDWKLIGNAWDTTKGDKDKRRIPLFLSNLAADIGEQKDYAGEHAEIVDRLRKIHDEWESGVSAKKLHAEK